MNRMINYDESKYYVDFSRRENLTEYEKATLENIQKTYRPIERVDLINEFVINGKITLDDFESLTGLIYSYR